MAAIALGKSNGNKLRIFQLDQLAMKVGYRKSCKGPWGRFGLPPVVMRQLPSGKLPKLGCLSGSYVQIANFVKFDLFSESGSSCHTRRIQAISPFRQMLRFV